MGPFDVAWLSATLRLATPLILASSGEVVAERTGILNIGLEGMILMGAFFSFLVAWMTGSVAVGVLAGMVAGMALAGLMAVLSIRARADQIVVGVGLNILAFGVTTFLFREIFAGREEVLLSRPSPVAIPLLSRIPVIGPVVFRQTLLVYLAFLTVAVVWFVLFRTTWGLSIRATGEVPEAADSAGIGVARIRWVGTLVAGLLAGAGGAFLSVGQLGLYIEGMSAGRGFLALAAVIFGRWRPLGVLGACLVFGAADALQLRLQAEPTVPRQVWFLIGLVSLAYLVYTRLGRRAREPSIWGLLLGLAVAGGAGTLFVVGPRVSFPPQLWLTVPFILALLALAGFVGRARMPSALATAYRRGG